MTLTYWSQVVKNKDVLANPDNHSDLAILSLLAVSENYKQKSLTKNAVCL